MKPIAKVWRSTQMIPIYVAIAHGTRLLSALVIIKLIAIFVGPQGLAKLGFFMSLANIISILAGGGIATAITKYAAEFRNQPIRLLRFLGAASLYGGTFSIVVMLLSAIFAKPLAQLVLSDITLWWMMPIFGLAQLLAFVGAVTISTMNGLGRQDQFAKITFVSNAGSVIICYVLITHLGINGGALALAVMAASIGITSLFFITRTRIFGLLRPKYQKETFIHLFKFSLMSTIAAILFPICEIAIRAQLITAQGLEITGYWQGMIRLSGAYIGFFAVYLATTFIPSLSSTASLAQCRRMVLRQIPRIVGAFSICGFAVYLLRNEVIETVFSIDFLPIADVIQWQLIGDLLRVGSYVVGFLALAKAQMRLYLLAELTQYALYLGLTSLVIAQGGGLAAITQAYALSYGLYFIVVSGLMVNFTRGSS
jgi:O-antigen/teichoic acid export membrane protein